MGVKQDSRFMKMFKVMAAFMLGIAFCLGFTACSDNDENGNGNDGDNTTTVVNPEKVFTGGLPKSVSGMSISQNEEGLVTSITTDEGEKAFSCYTGGGFNKFSQNNSDGRKRRCDRTKLAAQQ